MKKKLSEEEIILNEKKKEYLKQFQECVRAVRRIEEQIKEIETDEMCPSALCMNGIPVKASFNDKDLSAYIAKKEKLLTDMIRARHKRIVVYQDIFERIEHMNDENERMILTLRYIKGLKWEDIACQMSMDWSWVHRLHAKALKNFELPKEAIESNYYIC